MSGMQTPELAVEQDGAVLTVTFNRPSQRNAMTFAMYDGLHAACERADADDGIRSTGSCRPPCDSSAVGSR
jgi:enoyl-CoA hydratase/carnithine racemase